MAPSTSVEDYLRSDYPRTLFPLTTTLLLMDRFAEKLKANVYGKVLGGANPTGFRAQQRCYAAKRGHNLRRTVKLDPLAEYFVYDVVYRNRRSFRKDHRADRRSFGYRFVGGLPESMSAAYSEFKRSIARERSTGVLTLKADVATYFNSIYHHDLVQAMRLIGWAEEDAASLGRFLREANVGRSVDCLPHGLHPCKALGSEFLRFVDNSYRVRSAQMFRFLDDMHFFDVSEEVLVADLLALQQLLGEKGLSLNDEKTQIGAVAEVDVPREVDDLKQELLQIRRERIEISGVEFETGETVEEAIPLSPTQLEYLLGLLASPDLEESDAELVLVLLRDHAEEVLPRMFDFLAAYPGLMKSIYHYARLSADITGLDEILLRFIKTGRNVTEYQLFWVVKIGEDFLSESGLYGDLLMAALDHENATIISRAKVLEIADVRFGLPDRRDEVLRSGRSDWEAWAAAAGSRAEPASGRNHRLNYFAKHGLVNELLAECISSL